MTATPDTATTASPTPDATRPTRRERWLAAAWVAALRLLRATWRVRVDGLDAFDRDLAAGRPLFVAFWHGQYVPLFVLLAQRRAVAFSSLSARGRVIGEICRRFGYEHAMIPDHGRERSREVMRRRLRERPAAGVAVDGPLGPYQAVKAGFVALASELGMAVYPAGLAAAPRLTLALRWDRMELPLPFARVTLVLGDPFAIPATLDDAGVATWQAHVATALHAAGARAAVLAAHGNRPSGPE